MPRKLLLVAVSALMVAFAAVNANRTLDLIWNSSASGWIATFRGDVIRVGVVRPGGPVDGVLLPGDEVIALDGAGVTSGFDPRLRLFGPPRPYRLLVRRDGRLLDLALRTTPIRFGASPFFMIAFLLVNMLFLVSGLLLLALRPHDLRAALLALAFMLFSSGGDLFYPLDRAPAWMAAILVAGQGLAILFWPLFLHFVLVFPEPSRLLVRWPRLAWLLYLVPASLVPLVLVELVLRVIDPPLAAALRSETSPVGWLLRAVFIVYSTACVVGLVLNYRQASGASRRKLRVVVVGSLVGFLPLFVLMASTIFFDFNRLSMGQWQALIVSMLVSLPLVPLSFAYAIVRHQVIPIRLMIRHGVRYLLVARGFYLVEAVVLLAVIGFLLTGSRAAALDRLGGRADLVATGAVGLVVFGLLQLANRRVIPAIDRRFFRESYDAQRIMAQIGEGARRLASTDELLGMTAATVGEALHPESFAVYLREADTGDYPRAFPPQGPAADEAVVGQLCRSSQPVETEEGGLHLPIVAKGDLIGILSVGQRRGDLPYSRSDRRLLEAVAWQLAFTIENSRLILRKAEEERLRREIEVASEVQRRLFPDRPPDCRRLDLAGCCHPAQGVGGDYYDFLRLPDGRIALAVADVAGKGISAALLMSVVQASLRSQAGSVPPCELVASMNRLLYRSVARNRFATFFYAEFEEGTGRLHYVNAGHNPPLLLRNGAMDGAGVGRSGSLAVVEAAPATLVRLQTGGLVIGAVAATAYEQAVIELRSGDVLLAFTDGVTEAWNSGGEEFGEERLSDTVGAVAHLPAAAIAEAVVRSVRDFAGDAPQHDDITLVVAKVR